MNTDRIYKKYRFYWYSLAQLILPRRDRILMAMPLIILSLHHLCYRIKLYEEYENGFRQENEKCRVLQKYVMYYVPVDVLYMYERFDKLVWLEKLSIVSNILVLPQMYVRYSTWIFQYNFLRLLIRLIIYILVKILQRKTIILPTKTSLLVLILKETNQILIVSDTGSIV